MPSLLTLLVVSAAWATECAPVSGAALSASANEATRAFFADDEPTFGPTIDTLRRDLGCAGPLTADDAAAIHLALALDSIYRRNDVALESHLRALLALRPDFTFTADEAPPGGALDRALQAARGPTPHTPAPVAAPCGGALPLTLDGTIVSGWSGERAALAQLSVSEGAQTRTTILLPGVTDPFADVICPVAPADTKGRGLALAGLGLGLTAGAAWGIAAWSDAQANTAYDAIAAGEDPGMAPTTLQGHATRANVGSVAAIGLGLGGLTLGATWILRF